MSGEAPAQLPNARNKGPTPFANFGAASGYPAWKPIDTQKRAFTVLRLGVYTTFGAYAWLYIWRRSTIKIAMPLAVTAFATVAVGTQGIIANLREKNDSWNTFVAVGAANLAVLSAGFKSMPAKHKLMSGVGGTVAATLVDRLLHAQSTSFLGRDIKYMTGNGEVTTEHNQEFWDVMKRRPMSQTVDMLGVGRGIFKN